MKRIAVIPGDGTGPEVIQEGLKVLRRASTRYGSNLEFITFDYGGERYLRNGTTLPDGALAELRTFDAIYLGAIGHPKVKPGVLEREILLALRFELDLYVNLRPIKLLPNVRCPLADKGPKDIDFVVVREASEGEYTGVGGFVRKGTADEIALEEIVNTRRGVERIIRYAFDHALKRNKKKRVLLCAKTNVFRFAHDLWLRVFNEVREEYPGVEAEYAHVDAVVMWMVKNPERFDVIVTTNMFGDIITDLGAALQGGMGMAGGANINPNGVCWFEPIGGTAPKYAGKHVINPIAAILGGQMMLQHLGEVDAAAAIERAVIDVCGQLKGTAAGEMGFTTQQVGDMITERVQVA